MRDEEIDKQLRDLSCPYRAGDSRAPVWLDGYQAAILQSADKLRRDICGDLTKELQL